MVDYLSLICELRTGLDRPYTGPIRRNARRGIGAVPLTLPQFPGASHWR
jgi:hypothetical protein